MNPTIVSGNSMIKSDRRQGSGGAIMAKARWVRYGVVGDYVLWRNDDVFNITNDGEPASSRGVKQCS